MAKITKRSIDTLLGEPPGKVVRDTELRGFQARRTTKGVTYAYEYRAGTGRGAPVRRLTLGTHGELTPDQARKLAKANAALVAGGADPAADKNVSKAVPRFEDFAAKWLDEAEKIATARPREARLRLRSIANYRSLLKRHVGPEIGKRQLHSIAIKDVQALHGRIGKEKPATANRCLEFIGSVYRAAGKAGWVQMGTNPAKGVEAYRENLRQRFLSPAELAKLGDAIHVAATEGVPYDPPAREGKKLKHVPRAKQPYVIDQHTAAALRLLIFTGARLREILHARWEDFDAEHGQLKVFGKTGERHIWLPAPAVEIISGLPKAGRYIIASSDPERPKADLAKPWKAVSGLAGLEGVRIHDLRHSFASVAVSGGASLPMIGKLLGHTQAQTTKRYAHLADDPVRAAAESAASSIMGAMAGQGGAEVVKIKRSGTDG